MDRRAPLPRRRLLLVAGVATCTLAACGGTDATGGSGQEASEQPSTRTQEDDSEQSSPTADASSEETSQGPVDPNVVGTVATGLAVPWGIDFLPDGSALVTERDTTKILHIKDGSVRTVGELGAARPQGEAGLLGIAVSPTYEEDSLVFVYFTSEQDNRVVKMTFDGQDLGPPDVVIDGIPSGFIHDGGRLEFGPDGHLYVSTGEVGQEQLAQDPNSLGGKILRISPDGDPAPGNPDENSPVWTLGHRNVQGLAFDDQDRLWASEFGANAWDELNLVEKGENYGWPEVEGKGDQDRFQNPRAQWNTSKASPSGLAYHNGYLWMASLRGQRLWQIEVTDSGIGKREDHFVGNYGRLRTVVAAPDGNLWVATSNKDGRGNPNPKDDQILIVELR